MKADPLNTFSLQLQPLSDIHFNPDYDHDGIRKAHRPTLFALTGIAVFILLTGVTNFVNLATAQSVQRAKEIGIRKVLGASATNIVSLLSKEIVILVIIALLIASPAAWYFMHGWLQDFAYRINISWWVFGASGLSALAVAMLSISLQALKAATANPLKSLRSE